MIPLTVASSDARIYVNPDHIVFIREVNNGTQIRDQRHQRGRALMPTVKEPVDEVYILCRLARAHEEGAGLATILAA